MKALKIPAAACLVGAAMMMTVAAYAKDRDTGRGTGPVVFVTSQGLYYDSIVVADPLPAQGRFQQLIPGENGLSTEFGPGAPGHLGGRWWIDLNEDGVMDSGDRYFLCPLLGPGREHM
ncbi:MAG: hypothetical protein OEY45_00175 [Gammaproteobacteria bacterium]|nr:hypothetical protein [Gammaproteobacteria bacterium]